MEHINEGRALATEIGDPLFTFLHGIVRAGTEEQLSCLRLAITGQFEGGKSGLPSWDDPGTIETLDLCLSCKACKSECPSNVDIARLKAEYTAQRHRTSSPPFAARLMSNIRTLNQTA